jgi:hypothetical protein
MISTALLYLEVTGREMENNAALFVDERHCAKQFACTLLLT